MTRAEYVAFNTAKAKDLRTAIRTAALAMPKENKAAFDKIYDGKSGPWMPVDNSAYQPIIELNRFVDSLRRKA